MDFDRIVAVLRALEREGVAYKIIGGVAMNLQGLARATRDLDIFVKTDEENIARLRRALKSVFDDESIDDITAEDLAGEYPAIQYVPPVDGFHLDILARLGNAFDFDSIVTEPRMFDDVTVQVATPATLYAMKHATVRPHDQLDAAWLRAHSGIVLHDPPSKV